MLTEQENNTVKEICDTLLAHKFAKVLNHTMDLYDWTNNYKPEEFSVFAGCSKIVIVTELLQNWVLKFDKNLGSPAWRRNVRAEDEVEYYKDAVAANVSEYFPASILHRFNDDFDCVIQERAICNEDRFSNEFYSYAETVYNSWQENCEDENEDSEYDRTDRICDIKDELSDEERLCAIFGNKCGNLIEFVEQHHINDLHEGNYGVSVVDHRTVIIDFCGY